MSVSENVREILESGISPIVLSYEKIEFFDSEKIILRSLLDINSLELGKLTPREYRVVAGRSKQGGELLSRQIQKVFDAYPKISAKFPDLNCVTIPILPRTLLEGVAASIIFEEFERNAVVPPDYICFEISSDVLFEEMASLKERFAELRDLNVKIAISDLGDEFCPIFRLRELPFDFAFADEYSLKLLESEDESSKGLSELSHLFGAKVFATGIKAEQEKAAKLAGYDGFSISESLISLDEEEAEDTEEVSALEER